MRFLLIIFIANDFVTPDAAFCQATQAAMDRLAQRLHNTATASNHTSVYISTNKNIYIAGEDLWFNAFILNAADFSLSSRDQTLYVQVQQTGSDSIVWQEMYPVTNGKSFGHVFLPQTLPSGSYLVKAYTAHSFFSHQPFFYSVAAIRVVKKPQDINRVYDPVVQKLPHIKSHFQFNIFPEGGNVITDLPNNVGFKAVGLDGHPLNVKATLLKDGVPLLTFQSVHSGMGNFLFVPQKNSVYQIHLEDHSDSIYALPKIKENGITMRLVSNEKSKLIFKIYATRSEISKRVFLRVQIRGAVQSVGSVVLKDSIEIKMPVEDGIQGIAEATLFNEQLKPLAERLVYVNHDRQLKINFSFDKDRYVPKEKVKMHIKTTDPQGHPIPAVLSARIYDNLFQDRSNIRDIVNYYFLSTQLRGKIYDPSYYFDSTQMDRKSALDLLLLCQGWRRYNWNEEILNDNALKQKQILVDTMTGKIIPVRSKLREKEPTPLMFFNYNKTSTQLAVTDSMGHFVYTPQHLTMGRRFFVRYFSKGDHRFYIPNGFDAIAATVAKQKAECVIAEKYLTPAREAVDTSDQLQYAGLLEEVTVTARGRGFSDPYLGYLDSIAKFEEVTDYVCNMGYNTLNCPWCGSGSKRPVEGHKYHVFIAKRQVSVPHGPGTTFTADEMSTIEYHYPKYTEEDLLKKFNTSIIKGYYNNKEFYEPGYDKENESAIDNRNTILWKPLIVTDNNGEATIEFYCSDVRGIFKAIIEGVGEDGLLGVNNSSFRVLNKPQ